MSETPPTDRILSHLRDRLETLDAEIRERQSRRDDLLALVAELSDGRSRVSKGVKRTSGNNMAAIEEVRGILRPEADAAAEQETAGP